MDEILKQILDEIKEIRKDVTELKEVQLNQDQLLKKEELNDSDKILEYVNDRTEALNRRVYEVETNIQLIMRIMTEEDTDMKKKDTSSKHPFLTGRRGKKMNVDWEKGTVHKELRNLQQAIQNLRHNQ